MAGFFPKNPVVREIIVVLWTLLTLLCLPVFLLIALGLFAFRAVLVWYKNKYKPDYGDILSGISKNFGSYDPYNEKCCQFNVANGFILDGHASLKTITEVVDASHQRFVAQGIYPQLRQELTSWMGYPIWKDVSNKWTTADHVKMLDDKLLGPEKTVNDDNIADLCHRLNQIPFTAGSSPWEYLITHQVRLPGRENLPTTLLIFRCHHALGDGVSFMQYFGHLLNGPVDFLDTFLQGMETRKRSSTTTGSKKNNTSLFKEVGKVLEIVFFPVLGVYDFWKFLSKFWDVNEWHQSNAPWRTDFHYKQILKIPKKGIKAIRIARQDPKFVSVILGALTAGIRKYMIRHKIKVPESISSFAPVPIPQGKMELTNNILSLGYTMPTGLNNREKILEFLDQQSYANRKSKSSIFIMGLANFFGLMPKFITFPWIFTTATISNLPGYEQSLSFKEHALINVFSIPSARNTSSIHYWCIGYNGTIHITMGISKDIMPNIEQANELWSMVSQEFEAFSDPNDNEIIKDSINDTSSHKITDY